MLFQIQFRKFGKAYVQNIRLKSTASIKSLSAFITAEIAEIRKVLYTAKKSLKLPTKGITAKVKLINAQGDYTIYTLRNVKKDMDHTKLIKVCKDYLQVGGLKVDTVLVLSLG